MEEKVTSLAPTADALDHTPAVDISDEAFAELQASLDKTESMKNTVAEAIVKANEKGLNQQAARLRILLRKLFAMEGLLRAELSRKEIAKLTAELETLEAEYSAELLSPDAAAEDAEAPQNGHGYAKKAKTLRVFSKIVGYAGAFASLFGCIAYLLLTREELMGLPFSWWGILVNAGALLLFTVIALLLHRAARANAAIAKQMAADHAHYEAEKQELLESELADVTIKAYALELEKMAAKTEAPAEEAPECCCMKHLKKSANGVKVSVKTNPKAIAAAAVVGVVAVIAASLIGKGKKKKEKCARIQGIRLEWGE
ncbi:MAG: hypothetical protein IJX28_03125 [Clostridia bacterium]|nr:hypothetical protein [Clostridia bacterium]